MTRLLIFAVTLLLAACSARDIEGVSSSIEEASQQTVFFATQRNLDQTGRIFGEERFETMHYGRINVSIPPTHEPGQLEWRTSNPDPRREFAVTGFEETTDINAFVDDVFASKVDRPRETLVFVHGYNTTAAEAVFRLSQIQEDFGLNDPAVLFAWPSAGQATGYVYDRDSVLFARDDLEATLTALTENNNKVFLVAHSLGTHLTMETLRQAALRNNRQVLRNVAGVILMSPDIDPDVFRSQARAIGALPQPFFVFAARQDRALNLSSVLTGRRPRVGRLVTAEEIGRDDVTVFDFSNFATGKGFDHLVPVTSPTAISLLRGIFEVGGSGNQEFGEFVTQPASANSCPKISVTQTCLP